MPLTLKEICDENEFGGAVHRCIHAVCHIVEDHAREADIPVRFAATKLIEGDPLILERLGLDQNEKETLEHLILQMEKERGLDRSAAIASIRREVGRRWAQGVVLFQCGVAWIMALLTRGIVSLFL